MDYCKTMTFQIIIPITADAIFEVEAENAEQARTNLSRLIVTNKKGDNGDYLWRNLLLDYEDINFQKHDWDICPC